MLEKLIIDTDPGIDDALAIASALADPGAELLALTTVYGNASIEHTTTNAHRILEALGHQEIPVYVGAHQPIALPPKEPPAMVHGEDGLGDLPQAGKPLSDASEGSSNRELSAAQFIVNTINQNPGQITLIPLGPLTNIAQALALDPGIASKVKRVVLMGGNLHVPGNISAAAEANIYCDPHAADQVFGAHWPVVVVGLDVTHQVISKPDYFERLGQCELKGGKFLHDITQCYLNFYQGHYSIEGCHIHDSSAVACALHPEWFTMERGQLRVLTDELYRGKLVMHKKDSLNYRHNPWRGRPEIDVAVDVQSDKVLEWLESLSSC